MRHSYKKSRLCAILVFSLTGLLFAAIPPDSAAQQGANAGPRPIRNDVAQDGEEVLMLRHQRLEKGSHERFYNLSREGVWPWFEKIGARIVGQWQVFYPDSEGESGEYDEGWRLARYQSYEHWEATRQGQNLGGNGPDFQKNNEALRVRNEYRLGSDAALFLEGHMAPGGPYYLPGLEESYERVEEDLPENLENAPTTQRGNVGLPENPENVPVPVRNDVAQAGEEIVTLRYWKIKKGAFDEFYRASEQGVWPYFEKLGARVIGQWKRIHPPASNSEETPGYDEVYMMTRYASYEHWQASRQSTTLGGNGPDYDAFRDAVRLRRGLSMETRLTFLRGYMYHSPPKYMPGLKENYRRATE